MLKSHGFTSVAETERSDNAIASTALAKLLCNLFSQKGTNVATEVRREGTMPKLARELGMCFKLDESL
jgi:hypothetical protein